MDSNHRAKFVDREEFIRERGEKPISGEIGIYRTFDIIEDNRPRFVLPHQGSKYIPRTGKARG